MIEIFELYLHALQSHVSDESLVLAAVLDPLQVDAGHSLQPIDNSRILTVNSMVLSFAIKQVSLEISLVVAFFERPLESLPFLH